jgi:MFS family permease
MILGGLGGGTYHPVGNALISNLFKGMVGRAFGFIGMGASLGLFFGPFASGYIGQQFGWRTSCTAFALFGCMVAVAFWIIMPEEEKASEEKNVSGTPIGAYLVALLPVVIVFGLRDFCLWGATYLTPAMSETNFGFTKNISGTLIGLMSLTGIISQPLAGTLSDHIGRRRMIFIFLLAGGLAVSLFPYLSGTTIFAAALLSGFTLLGTVPVIDAAAADIVPPAVRGRVFGVMMTLGITFGALSPYMAGLIHDLFGGYRAAYLIIALTGLAGAALVFKIPSKR